MKRVMMIAAAPLMGSNLAFAAEAIEGNRKTASSETTVIAPLRGAVFCVTLKTAKYAGKQIGKLSGKGNSYSGEITDPTDDKTYSSSSNSLNMQGCVLKVLCKSQTWTRL